MPLIINKNINHKQLWIDSMTGMSMGFFSTLIIGSFLSILGIYTKDVTIFDEVKYIVGSVTPFAIGIAMGMKSRKSHLQSFAIGLACLIVARSQMIAQLDNANGHLVFDYKVGFNFDMKNAGDVFAAWVAGVSVLYIFELFQWESSFDFLVVPLLGIMLGLIESFWLTYLVSIAIRCLEWILWQSSHQGAAATIGLSPVIGLLMGISLSMPTSSAAMALALNLTGDAAVAAMAGTAAQMVVFGVMAWWSSHSITKTIAVGIGTSMLLMPNYTRRPILLVLPCIASIVTSLVAVAAFHGQLPFPLQEDITGKVVGSTTSGMGTVALYGQIFTLNDNGWGNYLAWLNVIFIQLAMPILIGSVGIYLFAKKGWIKKEWLQLWENSTHANRRKDIEQNQNVAK